VIVYVLEVDMTIRLGGEEAIRAAEALGLRLSMYASPTDLDLTIDEARRIDPRWIYLDIDALDLAGMAIVAMLGGEASVS
jgi:hypothetical protein